MEYAGKLVIIEMPTLEKKAGALELLADAQAAKEAEFRKSWNKLKVDAVGPEVTFCKPGDHVLITPKQLSYADQFELNDKIYFAVLESHCIGKH